MLLGTPMGDLAKRKTVAKKPLETHSSPFSLSIPHSHKETGPFFFRGHNEPGRVARAIPK